MRRNGGIVLSFVLLTACGKKSDSVFVHATLVPLGDEPAEQFLLVTPLEETPFTEGGTAKARVRRNAVSLVAAVRPDGKMALMDVVVTDDSSSSVDVNLDTTQTVRALAFLWPPNITIEPTQAREVLETIESDLSFSKAVSQFAKAWKESEPLLSSYLTTPMNNVALGAQARLPEPPELPQASPPTNASAQVLPLQLKHLSAQVATEGDQLKLTLKAPDALPMDWIVEATELDSGSPSFPRSREALAAVANPRSLPTRPELVTRALLSSSIWTIGEESVRALALKLNAGGDSHGAQPATTIPFSAQREAAYLVRAYGQLAEWPGIDPQNGAVVGANIARYYLDAVALTTDLRGGDRESVRNTAVSYIAPLALQYGQNIASKESGDATIRSQVYGSLAAVWDDLTSDSSLSPGHKAELKFLSQFENMSFNRIRGAEGIRPGAAGFSPRLNALRKVPASESVIVVVGDPWSTARDPECPAPKAHCADGCVDLNTTANCGACGKVCSPGTTCLKGDCFAPVCSFEPVVPQSSTTDPDMMLIPDGGYWRWCNKNVDIHCEPSRGTEQCVHVSAFEIDRTEVTQSAYARCVAAGACPAVDDETCDEAACEWNPAKLPNRPAVLITWEMADSYCRWTGKRLPTESEWERAARGSLRGIYPWGSGSASCANASFNQCGNGVPLDVGSLSAGRSPFGVLDMSGNAAEWVSDWWDASYDRDADIIDPKGGAPPADGTTPKHIVHGGAADSDISLLRVSSRQPVASETRDLIGFRCARGLP